MCWTSDRAQNLIDHIDRREIEIANYVLKNNICLLRTASKVSFL